jgi:dipeptidyl aminopeptidase/acylaminoacyl peptidase
MLSDVTDGVKALAAAGVIDGNRVCLTGADLSGYSALQVLAKQKLAARCTVVFAAPTNLRDSMVQFYWLDAMNSLEHYNASRATYEDVSPYVYSFNVKSPVMLIHPKQDTFVPPDQSASFAAALKKAGVASELVEIEGSDHFLWDEATRVAALKASIAFVERYNPPK